MDTLVSSSDSHKLRSKNKGDKKDLISKLPDGVLHHILSFLSTKDAIRTSILARRWKFLWTFLSDFNLVSLYPYETQKERALANLVDRILQKAKYIKRFHLDVGGFFLDAGQINSWISALMKYKLEELHLSSYVGSSSFVLAKNLIVPESLTTLILDLRCPNEIQIPCCIYFHGLKTLELSFVTFSNETSIQELFCGCPVLQKLTLSYSNWAIENVSIKFPTLKTLIVADLDCIGSCKVTIDAVNLVSFSCSLSSRVEYVLINITSLVEAHIDFPYDMDVARAVKLLGGICHVKSLNLASETLLALSGEENLSSRLPTFHNLTHFCVETMLSNDYVVPQPLLDILKRLPNLNVLDIAAGFDPDFVLGGEDWNKVPQCFTRSLKLFSISCFEGSAIDMTFLSFLLKNATFLERIKIFGVPSLSRDSKKQAKMSEEMQMMRRGFANCAIEFH